MNFPSIEFSNGVFFQGHFFQKNNATWACFLGWKKTSTKKKKDPSRKGNWRVLIRSKGKSSWGLGLGQPSPPVAHRGGFFFLGGDVEFMEYFIKPFFTGAVSSPSTPQTWFFFLHCSPVCVFSRQPRFLKVSDMRSHMYKRVRTLVAYVQVKNYPILSDIRILYL